MKPFGKIGEQDADRLFSGKAPAEDSGLENVADLIERGKALYLSSIDPDVESAHLAQLMQVVNLTDKGDLAARPASKVTGPHAQASGLPKRRRKFMLESIFATISAKIAAGGIAVAMAATGGLAVTGSLPDQVQTTLSEALDNVNIDIPTGETAQEAAEEALRRAEEAAAEALEKAQEAQELADENLDEVGDVVDDVDGEGEPNENAEFGQSVAEDARDGGVDGQEISERARERAAERKAAGQANRPEGAGPPADAGSQGDTGLEKAANTPAGDHIPSFVGSGSSNADEHRPEGIPARGR